MITLSKIAQLANVSVSTASKAFSGSNDINEETRSLIFSVAKKHGVFKKFYKAKFPHLTVAVVVPEFSGDHYSSILIEIQKQLEIRGCLMSVSAFDFSADNSSRIYDYYSKYTNVDGIIMIDAQTPLLDHLEIPTAVLGKIIETQYTSSICVDLQASLTEALEYFKVHNVTSVGFISDLKAKSKRSAFIKTMLDVYGLYDERYIEITNTRFEEAGYEAIHRMIEKGGLPRAIICAYDDIAVGAMRCLSDHGFSVPDDVALIGFDNNKVSKYTVPSLTTVDPMHSQCAESLVNTVINKILSNPDDTPKVIRSELRWRESSIIRE